MYAVGADPELFVTVGGEPVSAIGLIGGTKEEPRTVRGGAVQEDNVLAEFNIRPAVTEDMFVENLKQVMNELEGLLPAGHELTVKSSHHFTREYLLSLPDKAMVFGCDPDFDCWSGNMNPKPNPVTTLRTAGGHIHFGTADGNGGLQAQSIARSMELMLGIPSVFVDADNERREMYGKSGAWRPKPYGGEYRVLSNFWLSTEATMRWAYRQTMECIHNPRIWEELAPLVGGPEQVQRIINESDRGAAWSFCRKANLELP